MVAKDAIALASMVIDFLRPHPWKRSATLVKVDAVGMAYFLARLRNLFPQFPACENELVANKSVSAGIDPLPDVDRIKRGIALPDWEVGSLKLLICHSATFSRGFSFMGVTGKGGREVPPLVASLTVAGALSGSEGILTAPEAPPKPEIKWEVTLKAS